MFDFYIKNIEHLADFLKFKYIHTVCIILAQDIIWICRLIYSQSQKGETSQLID